jgi:O-antigen ligase
MREKIQRILDHARALALLFAGAGIVIWQDPYSADPLAPKTFCFAAGAGLFAAFSAMRLWWGARAWFPRNRAGLAAILVLASQFIAYLASSPQSRGESAFNAWLLVLLLGWGVYDSLAVEERQRRLMAGMAGLLLLCGLWSLAQLAGLRLGPMDAAAALNFGKRVSAGLGNPNFLGGLLVLSLPCALWLALRKPLAWALVALGAFSILATGSKAAWLGLGFEYFCFGHLAWHSTQEKSWRQRFLKFWAALGLAAALLGLLALPPARARLAGAFDPRNESFQFRIQTWKGSLKAFAAKPLLGHGPGSFDAVYPAYRPQAAMASQVQHSYEVTHPENWLLQMLAESGLLGLAALAFFFWLLLKPLWDAALRYDTLALALFLSLAGCLVTNLASLDLFLPSTFFFFTILAALALRLYGGQAAAIGIHAETYAAAILSFCLFFLASFPALQTLAAWRGSRSLAAGRALSQSGQFEAAIPLYDEALRGDPTNTEALYFKGASQLDSGHPAEALKTFDALQALAPDYVLVHDKRARADKALGRLDEAAKEWERQLELDPWLLTAVQELAGLYASQARLGEAARVLEGALPRFPGNADIARNLRLIRGK